MPALPQAATTASTIIGYVSFAVTLATLIRVTWSELSTLMSAPRQVHYTLSNLKEALWEEHEAVRHLARQTRRASRRRRQSGSSARASKSYLDRQDLPYGFHSGADFNILRDSVSALCQRFSEIERPYLAEGLVPKSKQTDWDDVETATRYERDGFQADYCPMTLRLRLSWLRTRGEVDRLWVMLTRLQQRRMLGQITDAVRWVLLRPRSYSRTQADTDGCS